jgi:eukaryotic-like serine/threonine-protein kinase
VNPWESRWQILGPLGQGAAGATHLARERQMPSRLGALKLLNQDHDSDCRRRFYLEACTLAALRVPRIPVLLDSNHEVFETQEPLYLVMEHVPGPTLREYVERLGVLTLQQGLGLLRAVLDAVGNCHDAGVVHRDLTPENVVQRAGCTDDAVLLDFGAACNLKGEHDPPARDFYVGNRFVRLPELRLRGGDKRDPRSDLTTCVALLLFALTGESPSDLRDADGRSPEDRPPLATAVRALAAGPALDALLYVFARGFWPDLRHRWQSAVQLLAALDRLEATLAEGGSCRRLEKSGS